MKSSGRFMNRVCAKDKPETERAIQVVLLDQVSYSGAITNITKEACRTDLLMFGLLHFFFSAPPPKIKANPVTNSEMISFYRRWYCWTQCPIQAPSRHLPRRSAETICSILGACTSSSQTRGCPWISTLTRPSRYVRFAYPVASLQH